MCVVSCTSELNVLYKYLGKASGKNCPDLAAFLFSFSSFLDILYGRPVMMGIQGG